MVFKQLNTNDRFLQMLQANIAASLPAETTKLAITTDSAGAQQAQRSTAPDLFSGGTLISVALTMGQDNLVPHGLNRLPVVWVIMGQDTNATVWSPTTASLANASGQAQSANSTFINLRSSSNCTISVWVN